MKTENITVNKFTVTVMCPVKNEEVHFDISSLGLGSGWLLCDRRLASGTGVVFNKCEDAVASVLSIKPIKEKK